MNVVYHPAVQKDVSAILEHYDRISPKLGDTFWDEFMVLIQSVAQNPERHPITDQALRRVSFKRFPYHFLFRLTPKGIRIIVLRHHRRHPKYGLVRK